ncbi:hypothetical protein Pcinc_020282 [Petrolisthes cinctipes]|uniref:Uncharacterized protein n=1 Tax=Petrolisthes cinctipes TaxID=88211 RepID=A0AAE1KJZ7_PETCI|nr:hypothetical protein Pcinc_020282 [Petrolisthes cinctipes]
MTDLASLHDEGLWEKEGRRDSSSSRSDHTRTLGTCVVLTSFHGPIPFLSFITTTVSVHGMKDEDVRGDDVRVRGVDVKREDNKPAVSYSHE